MPYSKDHKNKSREKILASAYKLFISKGYEATSINEIMKACQLTHGAFYSHFKSKSDLYQHALIHATLNSKLIGEKPEHVPEQTWLKELLGEYLHKDLALEEGWPCPLAFFTTDVAIREPGAKKAYTNAYKHMNHNILNYTSTYTQCSEEVSLSVTAMIIGAVAIARTMNDTVLKEKLLDAARKQAEVMLDIPN